MEAQIIDGVIEQIKQIAGNYRIEKIVLFGSRARGDHSHANVSDKLLEHIKKYGVSIYG